MIVFAADFRKSTLVIKEASDFFASILSTFINRTRESAQNHGAWWDKFTGDEFLAYWMWDAPGDEDEAGDLSSTVNTVLHVCNLALHEFAEEAIPRLRSFSRNFPAGVALSIGIDMGPVHLVKIADALTIVGPPVVGAVRMVSAAKPWEIVGNVFLGQYVDRHVSCCLENVSSITMEYRETKEYDAQEVYVMRMQDRSLPLPPRRAEVCGDDQAATTVPEFSAASFWQPWVSERVVLLCKPCRLTIPRILLFTYQC